MVAIVLTFVGLPFHIGFFVMIFPHYVTGTLGWLDIRPVGPNYAPVETDYGMLILTSLIWFTFYFVIGAVIGWVYGKVKNRTKFVK